MNPREAYKILGVLPPFSELELRSAFRTKAKELHPDKKGDPEAFIAAREAYELLKPDAGKDLLVDPIALTVEGVRLETLGKGLSVSARPCNGCNGRGYTQRVEERDCPRCGSEWWGHYLSRARRVGCPICKGRGIVPGNTKSWLCRSCNGTGAIACFNPVFIKGAITQKERKRNERR